MFKSQVVSAKTFRPRLRALHMARYAWLARAPMVFLMRYAKEDETADSASSVSGTVIFSSSPSGDASSLMTAIIS